MTILSHQGFVDHRPVIKTEEGSAENKASKSIDVRKTETPSQKNFGINVFIKLSSAEGIRKTLAEQIRCTQIFYKERTPIILLVEIFTYVDDFCKVFEIEIHKFAIKNNYKKRRDRSIRMCILVKNSVNSC
jgi:hypothetical protein